MFFQVIVEQVVGVIKCVDLVLQQMCHLWKEKRYSLFSHRGDRV